MSNTTSPIRFLGKLFLSVKVLSVLLPTALFSLGFFASIAAAAAGRIPWSDTVVSGLISVPLMALTWAIVSNRRKALRAEREE